MVLTNQNTEATGLQKEALSGESHYHYCNESAVGRDTITNTELDKITWDQLAGQSGCLRVVPVETNKVRV
jgi:hypothetical protein